LGLKEIIKVNKQQCPIDSISGPKAIGLDASVDFKGFNNIYGNVIII
jgi:hypothetical protein